MALTPTEIKKIANAVMVAASEVYQTLPDMLKQDIRDAVESADLWKDDNKAAYNTALPVVFRTNATDSQKSLVLWAVIAYEYLTDPDSLQIANTLLGKLISART